MAVHVPVMPFDVDDGLAAQVLSVLDRLGLTMGVVDIKLTPDGEPVWLEVNPQGQFAFVDGLAGTDLLRTFAAFLTDQHALEAAG